tara:strand:- start:592 stop:855 length:264 start_codon:yes stop_codon:yes gene_type:complete
MAMYGKRRPGMQRRIKGKKGGRMSSAGSSNKTNEKQKDIDFLRQGITMGAGPLMGATAAYQIAKSLGKEGLKNLKSSAQKFKDRYTK